MSVAVATVLIRPDRYAEPEQRGEPGEAAAGPARSLRWTARPGSLERLALRHALLSLLTLGIHSFWGKVALRRRLWASVSLDGRPFAYTGTVRDLLVPALVAGGVLVLIVAAIVAIKLLAIPTPRPRPSPWRLLVTIPLVFMIGLRLWRARAYLLAHTLWSGRAGKLHGGAGPYALLHLVTMLAMPLTLGWVAPWRQTAMARRMWEATEIAGRRFTFTARPGPLYRRLVPVWLGLIGIYLAAVLAIAFTMGPKVVAAHQTWSLPDLTSRDVGILIVIALVSLFALTGLLAWYRAAQLRLLAGALRLDGARLTLQLSSGAFVRLLLENTALKVFSLGLLAGLAEVRLARHLVERLEVVVQPGSH
jgi:uncharacterized membrane protein YjgN (DUF898 family)